VEDIVGLYEAKRPDKMGGSKLGLRIMSAVIVKQYSGGYEGRARFSIRQRPDGTFQVWQDNLYEGLDRSYEFEYEPMSGLFGDIESAEAELFRDPRFNLGISK
jgi:hypothetical protein